MNRLTTLLNRWQATLSIDAASELFIRSMYTVLLWSTLKLSSFGSVIWGSDHLNLLYDPYTNIDRFAMLLNNDAVRPFWWVFAGLFAVLLLMGVLGWHNTLTRIVVAYLFVVLHFGNTEISTGGHHLTQQLIFFHVFLFKVEKEATGKVAAAMRLMHHLGFYAVWLQIGIMYLVAGYWKLKGVTWWSGDALLLTLSYKEFGFDWLSSQMRQNHWILVWMTYVVFAYQLLFIVLIWIKTIRKYFLGIGLIFHLSIAFVVGITDFGLFMVASYAIFIPSSLAKEILGRLRINLRLTS